MYVNIMVDIYNSIISIYKILIHIHKLLSENNNDSSELPYKIYDDEIYILLHE